VGLAEGDTGSARFRAEHQRFLQKRARHSSQMPSVKRTFQPRQEAMPLSKG
jgi:hypothetical protein